MFAQNQSNELLAQAEQQQTKLVAEFGLSKNQWWLDQCDQLIAEMALSKFNQCLIVNADFSNAYSFAHGVLVLTQNLMQNINNSDQLAHIMAHEHAHLVLNHHQKAMIMVKNPPTFFTKSRLKKFYRKLELEADQAATELLLELNRDAKQIHYYLMRVKPLMDESTNDHEKLNDRIQHNDLPAEKIDSEWLLHRSNH